jgi:putative DNA primase/helicase
MTDTEDIRKQVQERVEQEAAQFAPPDPDAGVVDSAFIRQCLNKNALGDGLLFAALFRDRYLYCKNTQEWFEWAGHFWQRDAMNRSLADVERLCEQYLAEYKSIGNQIVELTASTTGGNGRGDDLSQEVKKLQNIQGYILKRVGQLRGDQRRTACLKFAHTIDLPLAVKGEEFDMHPLLFPCASGVIDLEKGRCVSGSPGDYLSLSSPVAFTSIDEPAPLWEKSLLEIFNGNEDLIAYLQRLFGYCLTGLVREKVFPILYGRTGWNGRSLIIETISYIMGDFAGSIPSEMLLSQKISRSASGPSPDIMSLKGIRMAFASEIDEGQRFNASKIKWLTGKDELTGRNPHDKYPTRFAPTHKLLVMTNIQPQAPPHDRAFWERLHMIPFNISFVNRDPQETHERRAILDLDKQVLQEASGILAWLVRGCLLYQRDGLNPPREVREASDKYRRNEDILADFIDECCLLDPGATCAAAILYNRFTGWYHENIGKAEPSGTWFGKQLGNKFEKSKSTGRNVYHGITVKEVQG